MKKKIKNQFLVYCFFGTLGGFLEIFLFYFLYNFIKFPLIVSNVMAFLVAVVYSYYVNSKYVFKTIFRNFLSSNKLLFYRNNPFIFCLCRPLNLPYPSVKLIKQNKIIHILGKIKIESAISFIFF